MGPKSEVFSRVALKFFATVVAGDSFPVASLRIGDFEFRHRAFRETVRIGPALQADSRGVQMAVLSDRFSLTVSEVDHLDIQAEGAMEVVRTFREYVGRRSLTALGHNVQFEVSRPGLGDAVFDNLFQVERLRESLRPHGGLSGGATIALQTGGSETVTNLTLAPPESDKLVLNFNFHYELAQNDEFEVALNDLPRALATAAELATRFEETFATEGVTA